jgi:hypothetical protein
VQYEFCFISFGKRINLGSHVCWPNGKNEEALQRILHKCFLPSLAPFYQAVSEEKIFLNSSQSETRIALGGHIC